MIIVYCFANEYKILYIMGLYDRLEADQTTNHWCYDAYF